MRRSIDRILLALIVLLPATGRAQLVASGPEFQVNSHTTTFESDTYGPRVGAAADGSFVVSWQLGEDDRAAARLFDASGAPIGPDFEVLEPLSYRQQLAVAPDATFTVVWEHPDGGFYGVFKQRFASSGSTLGTDLQVNTYTAEDQAFSTVASDGAGNVLVTWESRFQDGTPRGSFAQVFNSSGAATGSEFQVGTYTLGNQSGPVVAGDPAGGFVVMWSDYKYDGNLPNLLARRYASSGLAQGNEFQVNAYTSCGMGEFGSSIGPGGDLVAVWACNGRDGDSSGIFGRRFASSGTPEGTEFQVNASTISHQSDPQIAHDENDGFAVTWFSDQSGSDDDIFARHFDSNGSPTGTEFRVNTYTFLLQSYPRIASRPNGEFVVVWLSEHQDGYLTGTFGRLLRPAGTPLDGKTLIIKNPPAGPAKNKVVLLSKDTTIATPQDAHGDPRCAPFGSGSPAAGGKLRVAGDAGDFTIDLPCAAWVANADRSKFTYRDASGATCKRVTLSAGRLLKAVCAGPQVAYVLGTAQDEVRASLVTGDPNDPLKQCVAFGAATSADVVRDGSNGRVYKAITAQGPAYCQ
jgi:hypothetical protein